MRSGSRCPAFYGEIPPMRWGILNDDGGYFYCITYNIAAAGTFDTPRAVDTIQVSVGKDGEHLPRLHPVLIGLRECLVKCGYIHFIHKVA